MFSDSFTDQHLGGTTFGAVTDRNGHAVTVEDAASAGDGVRVVTDAGAGDVGVQACPDMYQLSLAPLTDVTLTCHSITMAVLSGSATLQLPGGLLTVPAGATVTVAETDGSITITTEPESSEPATFTASGVAIQIPPGETLSLANGCLGDVDGDGVVSLHDVQLVLRALLSRPGQRRWDPSADFNSDGRIDGTDLTLVLASLANPVCRGEPPPTCDGDVDGDGHVTEADVRRVLAAMFTRPGRPRWDPAADVDGNGRVDAGDLKLVLRSLADPRCR